MSTLFSTISNTGRSSDKILNLTTFYGNDNQQEMLQLTQGVGSLLNPDEPGFIQLSLTDAYTLIKELTEWVKSTASNRSANLTKLINSNVDLRNSIFEETIKCERFISDLEVLEIPIYLLEKIKC